MFLDFIMKGGSSTPSVDLGFGSGRVSIGDRVVARDGNKRGTITDIHNRYSVGPHIVMRGDDSRTIDKHQSHFTKEETYDERLELNRRFERMRREQENEERRKRDDEERKREIERVQRETEVRARRDAEDRARRDSGSEQQHSDAAVQIVPNRYMTFTADNIHLHPDYNTPGTNAYRLRQSMERERATRDAAAGERRDDGAAARRQTSRSVQNWRTQQQQQSAYSVTNLFMTAFNAHLSNNSR